MASGDDLMNHGLIVGERADGKVMIYVVTTRNVSSAVMINVHYETLDYLLERRT